MNVTGADGPGSWRRDRLQRRRIDALARVIWRELATDSPEVIRTGPVLHSRAPGVIPEAELVG